MAAGGGAGATGNEARLGWVERPDPRAAPQPRTGVLAFEDLGWARRALGEGRFGPAPRRMADVVAAGDVVLVEVLPAGAGQPRATGRPDRLALRQIPQVEGRSWRSTPPLAGCWR
ncbi:hypothetical protein ACFQU2_14895 [Siccirubricoccus deserti]